MRTILIPIPSGWAVRHGSEHIGRIAATPGRFDAIGLTGINFGTYPTRDEAAEALKAIGAESVAA